MEDYHLTHLQHWSSPRAKNLHLWRVVGQSCGSRRCSRGFPPRFWTSSTTVFHLLVQYLVSLQCCTRNWFSSSSLPFSAGSAHGWQSQGPQRSPDNLGTCTLPSQSCSVSSSLAWDEVPSPKLTSTGRLTSQDQADCDFSTPAVPFYSELGWEAKALRVATF